jgi:hypothetical protein
MADKPPGDLGWLEPESAANDETQPEYPYNNITQTESGHSFEMDDTPSRERIRLQHRTGTFIEMHPNGDEVHKVYGDGYEITIRDRNVEIRGNCNITVRGDSVFHVLGDRVDRVEGDYSLEVKGKMAVIVNKDLDLATRRDLNFQAGRELGQGSFNFTSTDGLTIDSDLFIGGSLTADMITSVTRVDAGTGVSAGTLGFVSLDGGLSLGAPVAIPGVVNCVGFVFAGLAVASEAGFFNLSSSIWGRDVVNSTLYNVHTHIAPFGPTSPPLTQMV